MEAKVTTAKVLMVLGAAKLITDALGYPLFDDQTVDQVANGIAVVVNFVIGICVNFKK